VIALFLLGVLTGLPRGEGEQKIQPKYDDGRCTNENHNFCGVKVLTFQNNLFTLEDVFLVFQGRIISPSFSSVASDLLIFLVVFSLL
jgi:hypothetical protein